MTVASPDITELEFSVLFDISTATPTVIVTNLSTVVNAANLQWIFTLSRPSGYPIHEGDFGTPEIDGTAFTTYTFTEPIPQPFRQIEFNKTAQYVVTVSVKDSNDDEFSLSHGAALCKPNGNNGKNNFGIAQIIIETKCAEGRLLVTDKTNLVYQSIAGTKVSTTVKLVYPMDTDGNQLADVTVTQLPAMLPLQYEGKGYNIYVAHVFDYVVGTNFTVRLRYGFTDTFAVNCSITLQPLFCEVDELVELLKPCNNDNAETRENSKKLAIVNAKMLKAHSGLVYPLSKMDVPAIVDEIKELLGVDCECCLPAGISNIGTVLLSDAVLSENKVCGDMLLSWDNDGNGNITLNYQNYTYSFAISGSEAFAWASSTSSCNKHRVLTVDIETLATEFLTEITNNPTLLNILNSITQRALLSCSGIDGGTVFNFDICNYSIELGVGNLAPTVVNVVINGITYAAPGGTLVSAASTIQTWLNSLTLGTFVVNYSAITNKTTITSADNENVISTITTNNGTTNSVRLFSNDCGLICNILQKIINWMQDINLVQIQAGVGLTICRFNTDGTINTKNFLADATASSIATYMADSLCNVVNYISDKLVTCANVKAIFADFTDTTGDPDGADIFYMVVNGTCQQVPLKNAALAIIRQIITDAEVKSEFCNISPCSSVSNCSPVEDLDALNGTDTTQTYNWSTVAGAVGYKWSIDGINYNLVTSTSAFIMGLTANTSYTFRVYPVYSFGDGSTCEVTDTFITTNTGATCAAPANLVLDNVTDTSFRATWDAVTGASGYQYRLNGAGWINAGLVLTVTPTGLTPSTNYNFEVRPIIGGTPCTESTDDNVTTEDSATTNLFIANSSVDAVVEASTIFGSPYFVTTGGSFPIGTGENLEGEHGTVSGVINLNMSGTFTAHADLFINGVLFDCVDLVSGAGANNFTTHTYLLSEIIEIVISDGACGA